MRTVDPTAFGPLAGYALLWKATDRRADVADICCVCERSEKTHRLYVRPFYASWWKDGDGEDIPLSAAREMAGEIPVVWRWVHLGCYDGHCPYCPPISGGQER